MISGTATTPITDHWQKTSPKNQTKQEKAKKMSQEKLAEWIKTASETIFDN